MAKLNSFTAPHWSLDTFYVFSDFADDQVDTQWVDTVTDTGTAAVGDERGGVMLLTPSDGTVADNDETYIATANELFIFATDCQLYAQFGIKFSEVAAGVANVAVGLQNAVGANTIVDDGGGVKVSGSTFAVYKVDGESVWRVATATNGVSTVTKSTQAADAGVWYEVTLEAEPHNSSHMIASAQVNGVRLTDANGIPIRHFVPIASATEMQLFAGIKLGAATNNDTLRVDYVYASQRRPYR